MAGTGIYGLNMMRLMSLDPSDPNAKEMVKSQLITNAYARLREKRDKAMLDLEKQKFQLSKDEFDARKKQIEAQMSLDERKMALLEKDASEAGGVRALETIKSDPYLGTPKQRADIYGTTGYPLTEVSKAIPGGHAYGAATLDTTGSTTGRTSGVGGGGIDEIQRLKNMADVVSMGGAGPARLGGAQAQLYNSIMNRIRTLMG